MATDFQIRHASTHAELRESRLLKGDSTVAVA